jgi:hypothetical protein
MAVVTSAVQTITVAPPSIKRSGKFTCIGWVLDPLVDLPDALVPLAVSDLTGTVGAQAIKMEIIRDSGDYRLRFSNATSKLIGSITSSFLNDKKWHFLSYVCFGDGVMKFYVDGIEVPSEDLTGEEGLPYNIAWSRYTRLGGGYVWAPYLYKAGQSISVYNWRYQTGLILDQAWLQQLMALDLAYLNSQD